MSQLPTQAQEPDLGTPSQAELADIHNYLGQVAIFNQVEAPESKSIEAQFDSFAPLTLSVCGC